MHQLLLYRDCMSMALRRQRPQHEAYAWGSRRCICLLCDLLYMHWKAMRAADANVSARHPEKLHDLICHCCISPQRLAMPDKSPSKLPSGLQRSSFKNGVVYCAPYKILTSVTCLTGLQPRGELSKEDQGRNMPDCQKTARRD